MTNFMKFIYIGMVAVCGIAIIANLVISNTFNTWTLSTMIWVIIAYLNEKVEAKTNDTSRPESTSSN